MRRLSGLAFLLCVFSVAAQQRREVDLPGSFHPYNVTGKHAGRFHSLVGAHDLDPAVLLFVRDWNFSEPLMALLERLEVAGEKSPNARLATFVVFLKDDTLPDVVTEDEERERLARELEKKAEELAQKVYRVEPVADKKDLPNGVIEALAAKYAGAEARQLAKVTTGERVTYKVLLSLPEEKKEEKKEEEKKKPEQRVVVIFDPTGKVVGTDDTPDEKRFDKAQLKYVVFALDSKMHLPKYMLDDRNEVVALLYRRYKVLARHDLPPGGLTDAVVKEIMQEAKEFLGARP
jgi:hypothetical protein